MEVAISKGAGDNEVQGLVIEIPEIILQCISRDEAALAIAQKVFKRLYENASNSMHVSTHIAILAAIHDVCKRVVKELTSWVIYSDEERKFNKDIIVGLIRSELIHLTEYNMHLAKLMDGGRNAAATEFAISLVQTCVGQEPGVSPTELYNLIDALSKVAQRPGSPESLQQLVEIARNSSSSVASQTGATAGKEEKARQSREKKDEGIKHLVIPTRDYLFAPSFDDIRQAVDFIHEHVKSGKTTYVHCKAGRGRSTTIVLCYLGFGCCGTMLKNIAAGKLCFLARVGKTMRSLVLLHSGRVACMELHLMVFRMKK